MCSVGVARRSYEGSGDNVRVVTLVALKRARHGHDDARLLPAATARARAMRGWRRRPQCDSRSRRSCRALCRCRRHRCSRRLASQSLRAIATAAPDWTVPRGAGTTSAARAGTARSATAPAFTLSLTRLGLPPPAWRSSLRPRSIHSMATSSPTEEAGFRRSRPRRLPCMTNRAVRACISAHAGSRPGARGDGAGRGLRWRG